jgi:hypothetical protein
MSGAVPPLPNTPSWRGAQLKKRRDNFTGGTALVIARCPVFFVLIHKLWLLSA